MRLTPFLAAACAGLLLTLPTPTPAGAPPAQLPTDPPPREAGVRGLTPVGYPAQLGYRKKLAVIVGINYENTNLRLRNAEQDAQNVRDLLVNCFGYKDDEVKLIKGPGASRQAIVGALQNEFLCRQDVTAADSVLFYFSGHGDFRPGASGGGQGYLYPADISRVKETGDISTATAINLTTDVVKYLRENCKARHKLLVLDCCHAGSVFRLDEGTKLTGAALDRRDWGALAAPAFQALAASREWQTASDGELGAGNSPFTASLVNAMCSLGRKALGSGAPFDMDTLFRAMQDDLTASLRGDQCPECRWIDGDRGQFHFFPDPAGKFPSGAGELTEEEQRLLVAMVPSTFGNWWVDEIPWFMPSLRLDILKPLDAKQRSSGAYLDADSIREAAKKLTAEKPDDPRYAPLRALLEAKDGETRRRAMREIVERLRKETARPDARAVDLHYLAVLQQKLAEKPEHVAEAEATYAVALRKYNEGRKGNPTLGLLYALCLMDHGILCLNTKRYAVAVEEFREARRIVARRDGPPPVPFLVFATCREADAQRRLGLFGVADKLMRGALAQITDYQLRSASALPLSAAVWKHHAWAMMEDCRFNEADHSFGECQRILEGLIKREVNPFQCKIDLFHVRHGRAMIKRFQGNDADAVAEFRRLTADIAAEMRELNRTYEDAANYAELKQQLAYRYQNSLDRQADCHLFGRYPDYAEAAYDYGRALRVTDNIPRDRRNEVRIDLLYRRAIALCLAPAEMRDTAEAARLCKDADELLAKGESLDKSRLVRAIAHALVGGPLEPARVTFLGVPVPVPGTGGADPASAAGAELWKAIRAYRPGGSAATADAPQAGRMFDRDEMERLMFAYRLLIERRKQWKLDRFQVAACCEELFTQCRAATRSGRARGEVDVRFLEYLREYYDVAFAAKVEEEPGRPVPVKELIELAWCATRGESYTKPITPTPVVVLYGCRHRQVGVQFYLLVDVPAGPGQPPISRCLPLKSEWNDLAVLQEASENRPLPLPEDVRQVLRQIKSDGPVLVRWHDPVTRLGYRLGTQTPPAGQTTSAVVRGPEAAFPLALTPVLGDRPQWDAPAPKSGGLVVEIAPQAGWLFPILPPQ
jgi:hypothetical protein